MTCLRAAFIAVILAIAMRSASPAMAQATADLPFRNITGADTFKWLPKKMADHRILYGTDPTNFGDLRLPKGPPRSRRFDMTGA